MPNLFPSHVLLGYAFIFISRIIDVSLSTCRTILLVRGERIKAASIGFFEVTLYVLVLNSIMNNLDNIWNLFVYALGFACGNLVGGAVEEKLAFGIQHIQVISRKEPHRLAELLREQGFGVTVTEGVGRDGPSFILQALLERKHTEAFSKTATGWDSDVFIIVSDAKKHRGGYIAKRGRSGAAYAKKK